MPVKCSDMRGGRTDEPQRTGETDPAMEKLTLVEVAPRWEGDAGAVLGWPDESWDEYATACVEHVDLHPAGLRASSNSGTASGVS